MAVIISGKEVSAKVRADVKEECEQLKSKGITPGLAVIIVGDDPASRVYVNNKKKACADVGFLSEEYALPAETTQEELLALIEKLNSKPDINGILCQLLQSRPEDRQHILDRPARPPGRILTAELFQHLAGITVNVHILLTVVFVERAFCTVCRPRPETYTVYHGSTPSRLVCSIFRFSP